MSDVERVKEAIDAVAFISTYVPLKRQGGRFAGRCPFHDDRSPSFSVRPDGLFHCFGCGVGGDILRFIELKEGLDFRAALTRAAEFAGVALTDAKEAGPDAARRQAEFAAGVTMLERARDYFHRMLLKSSKAEAARATLRERQIPESAWAEFGLGYAWGEDNDWTGLVKKKGWPVEISVRLGLTAQNQYRDRFHHRLMFPIADPRGRAAGFGGRRLNEDDKAKYINSPDSPWFHKGNLLFGFEQASAAFRERQQAVVCEGYTDVIRLHLSGVGEAVAPLGTAMTERHAAQLASRTQRVVLAFDADEAGERAALNAWAHLVQRGVDVHVLELPAGEDPDSFALERGADAVRAAVDDAPAFWPRFLADRVGGAADAAAKRAAIDGLVERLAGFDDQVFAQLLAEELAAAAGVSADALKDRLQRQRRRNSQPTPVPREPGGAGRRPSGVDATLAVYLCNHPEDRFAVQEELKGKALHPWLNSLLAGRSEEDPGYRQWLGEVSAAEPARVDRSELIAAVADRADEREIQQRLRALYREEERLRLAGDNDAHRRVTAQIQALRRNNRNPGAADLPAAAGDHLG